MKSRKRRKLTAKQRQLAAENYGLAWGAAFKHRGRGIDFDDLLGIGGLQLTQAMLTFDPKKAKISTYAGGAIFREIREQLRDRSLIHVPNQVLGAIARFYRWKESGKKGTFRQFARHRPIPKTAWGRIEEVLKTGVPQSVQNPDEAEAWLGGVAVDNHASETDAFDAKDATDALLSRLSEVEREIIELRFGLTGGDAMTLQEIGDRFGKTKERIRQILNEALEKMRERAKALGLTE